jgi:hypothetical protein
MIMPRLKAGLLCAAALGLACAEAAQAQAPDVSNLPRFQTNWQDVIKPGAGFWSIGIAQQFAYSRTPRGLIAGDVPTSNVISNIRQVYTPAGDLAYFEVLEGPRSTSFVRAYGDTFTSIFGGKATYARASDWTRQAIIADPLALGWRYQNLAVWQTGVYATNGALGATVYGGSTGYSGGVTPVPQSGTATFSGFMGGIYVNSIGEDRLVTADVGVRMDFGGHAADFYTVNTRDRDGVTLSELNITGTYVGLPNYPQMFGTLHTNRLQGSSTASFYGPAADEFGGVFTLTPQNGEGSERLVGAFGSKIGALPTAPFTSWSEAAKPNGVAMLAGRGVEGQYSRNATGGTNLSGGGVVSGPENGRQVLYTQTYDGGGQPASLKIETEQRTVSFSTAAGDTIGRLDADGRMLYGANPSRLNGAIVSDAAAFGWDYQSFGAWQTLSETPGAAIPTSGGATFQGRLAGTYIQSVDQRTFVMSDITFNANFSARNATFSTGPMASILDGQVFAGTGINGWVAWVPGANGLNGQAATVDGRMQGGVTARFYGPAAQEVGGVLAIGTSGFGSPQAINAAFGAKR